DDPVEVLVKLDLNGIAVGIEEGDEGVDLIEGLGECDAAAAVLDQELARRGDAVALGCACAGGGGDEGEERDEGQQGEKPSKPPWSQHGNHLLCGRAVISNDGRPLI